MENSEDNRQKACQVIWNLLKEVKLEAKIKITVTELFNSDESSFDFDITGRVPKRESDLLKTLVAKIKEELSDLTNYRVDQIFKNHWKVIEGIAVGEKITAFNAYDTEGNSEELKITNCFCLVWLSYSMHSLTPMANFVRNANSKIEFIGLSGDTENEKWLKMVKNNKWQGIKQVCSPGIESDLNTNGVPCLLVVNEGKIVFVGHPNEVDLNASIETFPVVATKVEEDVGGRNEWLFEKEGVYLKEVCEKARMVIRERTGTFNCEFILKLEKNCCNGKVVRRAIPMIMGTVSKPEYVILIELKQEIEDKFALEGIEIKVRLLQ